MLTDSCLCGSVHWRFDSNPQGGTACNCTACRRYGALWIYGHEGVDVHVTGTTQSYIRGKALAFHFCPQCACVVYWQGLKVEDGKLRAAVNLRLAEPGILIDQIPIDHFDGFNSFEDLPRDGKCVKDYWF
ncbi:MAG TPA: hypothetical protein VK629_00905 [Steroidobacteraceae bacterium]|nr:hypothetical protein [Steroidobacteraceae bacterium]